MSRLRPFYGVTGVVDWLRDQSHDALHLREQGLQRLPDNQIFRKAVAENRPVLTFDLDFGEIVAFSGRQKVSVVLFRLRNTRTFHIIERLRVALEQSGSALQQGAVVVVEESRVRVRRLPIGA